MKLSDYELKNSLMRSLFAIQLKTTINISCLIVCSIPTYQLSFNNV